MNRPLRDKVEAERPQERGASLQRGEANSGGKAKVSRQTIHDEVVSGWSALPRRGDARSHVRVC